MTVLPKVKVNNIVDSQNNRKNYFDTVIPQKFENWTKNTKDMVKYVKNKKIAKKTSQRQSDCHGCFIKTTGNIILIFLTAKF